MDVTFFESSTGREFTIEVWFFSTVLELKEYVQKYQGIPVSRQTLIFNNQIMLDDRDTEFYEILQGSRIQLQISPEPEKSIPITKMEPSSSTLSTKVQLLIKIPMSKRQISLGMDVTDTVGRLKEKIHEVEGLPINRLVLVFNGAELVDHRRSLGDYLISNFSEVNVIIMPFPPATTSVSKGSKKLKLMVLPKCGTQKIQVEVNALDKVGELRKELQRLQQHINFHLPTDGYFFIYKQNVMDDDRSYRWHDVKQGDTIEIFNGSVTGGS